MKIDGGCYCGNITYEAEIDPENVRICHCTDCQQSTGSAFRVNVPVPKERITFRGGQPKLFIKTAESGNKRAQAFCPECGSPLYSAAPADPQAYMLRVGTIRQRAQLQPKVQQWCRSALGWALDLGSIPQFPKQQPL